MLEDVQMRRNSHLINRSDLLAVIIEKIETSYSEDIALLICYGSYITGDYGGMSDIDFFFVPKTNRGYELGCQFILNHIGYDLWPVSWERLKNLSNLEDQPASILMDGEVLFASSEEDLRKLEDLKNNFTQNLNNDVVVKKMSMSYVEKAKASYFDLQTCERRMFFIGAINIVETLLLAIATLNGTYIKRGPKRIEDELERLFLVPAGFLENYKKLIRTNKKVDVQHIVNELIVETDKICKSNFDHDKADADPSKLAGFYEEFKSTYNKLLMACDASNYEAAYYAGFMIDRETQSFLSSHTDGEAFPTMVSAVLKNDFKAIRAYCLEHEQQLINLLDKKDIRINAFKNSNEFRQHFMEKMA
ncbi:MAG: nucleotidyltransferase domain-containing protein [Trueperaceae bacterium]|nr:nucleotidyltransferase domain-containing protein [Trueperaceae bacterium]